MALEVKTFDQTISVKGRFSKKLYTGTSDYSINLVRVFEKREIAKLPPELRENVSKSGVFIKVSGKMLPDNALDAVYEIGGLTMYKKAYGASIRSFRYVTPSSSSGLVKYLSSRMFKGVGTTTAENIVNTLGTDAIQKIYKNPEILSTVPKLKPEVAENIRRVLFEQMAFNELGVFIGKYGISTENLFSIVKILGSDAVEKIKEDPYMIMYVPGIGFKVADRIAIGEGCALDSEDRIKWAIKSVLKEDVNEHQNMFMNEDVLTARTLHLLNGGLPKPMVTQKMFKDMLEAMLNDKELTRRKFGIYLSENDECEKTITRKIVSFLKQKDNPSIIEKRIEEADKIIGSLSYSLSPDQVEAVHKTLSNRFSILTGGPGVGKTTTVKVIVRAFLAVQNYTVGLLAPTGKAGTLLSKSVGMGLRGHTIHHSCKVFESLKEGHPIVKLPTPGLYIIDESSMIDMDTAKVLLESLDTDCHVIFCGDPDQLPSVGKGSFLAEMLKCKYIPISKLTTVHRQSGDAASVVSNAYAINNGKTDLIVNNHFRIIKVNSDEEAQKQIQATLERGRQQYGDDIAILAPRNKKRSADGSAFYPLAVEQLNTDFQNSINPAKNGTKDIKIKNCTFRKGDKIIQMKNTDIANNGDTGVILDIRFDGEENCIADVKVKIKFDTKKEPIEYDFLQMQDINLAYAISIHKSQGSQYKLVVIPLTKSHTAPLYNRTLLYTAVTRAVDEVVIITDSNLESVKYCIRNDESGSRNTNLAFRLNVLAQKALAEEK